MEMNRKARIQGKLGTYSVDILNSRESQEGLHVH